MKNTLNALLVVIVITQSAILAIEFTDFWLRYVSKAEAPIPQLVAQAPAPPIPQPGAEYADLREEWKKAEGKRGDYYGSDLEPVPTFKVNPNGYSRLVAVKDSYVIIEGLDRRHYVPIGSIALAYYNRAK